MGARMCLWERVRAPSGALPQGEFQVGVVRIEAVSADGKEVTIAWWMRKGADTLFRWPDTPTFEPYMPNGRVEKTTVGLEALVSVPLVLTDATLKTFKPEAKSIAGQSIRLKKECITLLRTFLTLQRSDLVHDDDASDSREDASDSEDSDDSEDDHAS